jgi:hypothetical protein
MKLFEMLIDEENLFSGVNAVSIVENPAIQSDFVALAENEQPIQLAEVSKDKRILMGAALIPDKPIYRNMDGEEFYIYFSKDTVRQAAELFFKRSNHQNATLEHSEALSGMTVFESWIIEDTQMDKSRNYGLELPEGTWMVSMKVDDEDIWNNYVKNNKVFGFSIEGQFANKLVKDVEMSEQEIELSDDELKELEDYAQFEVLLEALADATNVELETYNDYPQSAVNNAKKVLKWREEHGNEVKGMTRVGWTRASQLARKAKLSRSTIARMASFKRHQKNAAIDPKFKSTPWKDKGYVAWLGWGGSSGVNWAIRKLKSIDKK